MWNRLINYLLGIDGIVDDFINLFPGKCLICSYHRYGINHGHISGPVEPHDCIERKRNKGE